MSGRLPRSHVPCLIGIVPWEKNNYTKQQNFKNDSTIKFIGLYLYTKRIAYSLNMLRLRKTAVIQILPPDSPLHLHLNRIRHHW
jgi:hypothetical protein